MMQDIYLDANATSPVLPAAIAAALDAMGARFGNPSSSHAAGLRAKQILDDARTRARRVLGAGAGRVLFTSGATEGIQTAVLSALCAVRERRSVGENCGDLLVYGATEHKAVSESLAHWNRVLGTGLTLHALPVDGDGRHRLDLLRELAPRAAMVCTMAANNETGVISDLDGIARVLNESGTRACWMVDCVQALGKLALGLAGTRIDYAPFSGHKLYAPKGIGLLYVREGAPFTPLTIGGGQEAGQRAGTENMAGIAALGAVLAALEEGTTFRSHAEMAAMRGRLADALRDAFPAIVFNAPFEHALPTTLNFAVPGLPSKELLDLFDAAGVRVSAGSACSAAKVAPSYVLEAMGLPLWRSGGAVRLSFGPLADAAFIDQACARIRRCGLAAGSKLLAPAARRAAARQRRAPRLDRFRSRRRYLRGDRSAARPGRTHRRPSPGAARGGGAGHRSASGRPGCTRGPAHGARPAGPGPGTAGLAGRGRGARAGRRQPAGRHRPRRPGAGAPGVGRRHAQRLSAGDRGRGAPAGPGGAHGVHR
jgi:cysteine sulfinate desulfinase/cysteine desulfurase-like protein